MIFCIRVQTIVGWLHFDGVMQRRVPDFGAQERHLRLSRPDNRAISVHHDQVEVRGNPRVMACNGFLQR